MKVIKRYPPVEQMTRLVDLPLDKQHEIINGMGKGTLMTPLARMDPDGIYLDGEIVYYIPSHYRDGTPLKTIDDPYASEE